MNGTERQQQARLTTASACPTSQAGFTVIEMLVTFTILIVVLVGLLNLFDLNSHLSRVQNDVAETQESLRAAQLDMVRMVRMAGRGGIPMGALPNLLAVNVQDNVPANTFLDGVNKRVPVVPNTDVLTVRGVLDGSVLMVVPRSVTWNPITNQGTFQVTNQALAGVAVPQDLTGLADAINGSHPVALILVSGRNSSNYYVAELNTGASVIDDPPTQATIAFRTANGTHADDYRNLSPTAFNNTLQRSVAYVGILDEYRYYIRDEHVVPGDTQSDAKPVLARAHVYPGTDVGYPDDSLANWKIDIADNISDLQVALGIDTANGAPPDGQITDDNGGDDEWLYNSPDDDPTEARWAGTGGFTSSLFYVRINTLAITGRRDRQYQAKDLPSVEDRDYTGDPLNSPRGRQFRRRTLRSIVDMRNIT